MLERLIIRDFQKHEKRSIDLDSITVLIGPNDAGKSSIIRALRWVCLNEAPADFVRWGASLCKVKLRLDGAAITRKREDGNQYILGDKEFNAIRNNVPDEVAKILHVSDLNFQSQHDSPFWFSETAGKISKQLNKIVSLDLIDWTLGTLANDLRRAKTAVDITEQRLNDARNRRDELDWVLEMDEGLSKLEAKQAQIESNRDRHSRLTFLISQVTKVVETQRNLGDVIVDSQKLVSKAETLTQLGNRTGSLRKLLEQYDRDKETLSRLHDQIHDTQEQLSEVKECPLCQRPLE